jgi:nucleoside-diphosphate-sugar epimerase
VILERGEQRVLVTGANGLIGSSIASYLVGEGYESAQENFDGPSLRTDYSNLADTRFRVGRHRPNVVINCAAKRPQSSLRAAPFSTYNHQIVLNLVAALEDLDQEVQFIQLGSSAEYAPTTETITETSECRPTSVYGQDKVLSTNFLMGLSADSGVKPVVLRPSTVYGRAQSPDMLIPMLRKAVSSGDRLNITNPCDVRDFIHVEDLARACACVIGNTQSLGEVFNVSTGNSNTVVDLLQMVSTITGLSVDSFAMIEEPGSKPQSPLSMKLSPNKFLARHNWTASIDLGAGLRDLFYKN